MKQKITAFMFLIVLLGTFTSLSALTTWNIPGDKASLAAAITDLNALGTVSDSYVLNLLAGNPQTTPAGGYSITASGTSSNTITIQGNGNIITAFTPQTSGILHDAIFEIVGGDYITIQDFVMQENAANTTTAAGTNNMTEWGVAVIYASTTNASQYITIKNNVISLNRTYQNTFGIYVNATHATTSPTTGATATGVNGGNHGLTIVGNSISNINNGITVVGPTAAADHNDGVTVGGSALNANVITNFGTTGTFSSYVNVSGSVNGILCRNTKNYNISYNTITSSDGGTTAGTQRGIYIPAASNAVTGSPTNSINYNTISLRSAVSAAIHGIFTEGNATTSTTTLNINNNNFLNTTHTVASSSLIYLIYNTGTPQFFSINYNTFTNLTVNTTGSFGFIYSSVTLPNNAVQNINYNSIVTGFNKTGAGGTVYLFYSNGSTPAGAVQNNIGNDFSNITLTGGTTMAGWQNGDGGAPTKTITNNTFNNWVCGSSAVTVLNVGYFGGVSSVSNNTVSNISGIGAITALTTGSSGAATSLTVENNTIYNINSTGTGGNVTGITHSSPATLSVVHNNTVNKLSSTGSASIVTGITSGATTCNIHKNKIYDLAATGATGVIYGLAITGGTTQNVYNNFVYDLRTPVSTATPAIFGFRVAGGTTNNISYNTTFIETSGAASFFTAALYISSGTTNNFRNNIFINKCIPGGGRAAAVWKTSAAQANVGVLSDKNIYYTIENPDLTTPIGYFSTSIYATLAEYKGALIDRDQGSFAEDVPFLSTTRAIDLHIRDDVSTRVEGNAIPIAGIDFDIDNESRNATNPDIGADEGNFMAVVAEPGVPTNSSPGNTATNIPINAPLVWSASSEGGTPTSYGVFFSQNTDPDFYDTVPVSTCNPPKEFGKTYYWKVKAINDQGSATGEIWSFSTASGVPALTYPGTDATGIPNLFTFTWNAVAGVSGYKISCGPSAGGPLVLDMVPTATNSYLLTAPLTYSTEYKWSVYSVNGEQTVQSAEWLFTTMADPNFYPTSANPYLMDFEEIATAGTLPSYWTKSGTKWTTQITTQDYGRAPRSGTDYATCAWSSTTSDWLFSRNMYLDASKTYDFGIWYNSDGLSGWASFKMYIGTGASGAAMTTELAAVLSPTNTTYAQLTKTAWQPPSTGSYVIGFQVIANSTPWYMCFDDFSVAETPLVPVFSIAPTSKNFGLKGVFTKTDQLFTISNAGQGTLGITQIDLTGDDCFGFVTPPSVPIYLNNSNPTSTFTIRYNPLAAGTYSASIKIYDDLSKEMHTVTLDGTAFDPILPLPYEQNFNASTSMPTNWTQSPSTWTIDSTHSRTGNGIYKNIYSTVPTGWFQTNPIGPITGSTRLSFYYRLMNYSSYPSGGAFAPAAGDNIKIYASTDEGTSFTQCGFIDNTNHTSTTAWTEKQVWLSGVKAANGDRVVLKFEANWGSGDWYIDIDDITVTHVATNPVFSINPTSKNYGDVQVGSYVEQDFTISNLGLSPLVIENGGITVTGADASSYTLINNNSYPMSITTTPVTISVRFTPPAVRETPYIATLQIVDNTSKATQSVALSGSGVYLTPIFSEGFDGTTFPPTGWSNYSITKINGAVVPTGYWERKTSETYNSTAGTAFIRYNYLSTAWACLELPSIDLPAKSKLVYYWKDDDIFKIANQDTTFCEISTNNGNTWSVIASLSASSSQADYSKVELSLNAYAGTGRLIRFRDGTNASYSAYGTSVDELSILGQYDYPAGTPVVVGDETITVSGGNANNSTGTIPDVPNASFVVAGSFNLTLIGAGPWTITIETDAPWGAYYQNGQWNSVQNVGGFITFVLTANKDIAVPIVLGDSDPTLPVELSSFTATITTDLCVKIAWIAQSETNHSGYNVLRGELNDLTTAIKINPVLIDNGIPLGTQLSYSYTDQEAYSNMVYYYWLESIALDGVSEFYGPLSVTIGDPSQDPLPPVIPMATKLLNAFPNPFNPNTNLRYSLKEAGKVNISIYNVKGQLIKTYQNEHANPGYYQVSWDGKDQNGKPAASGIYMYRMVSGKYTDAKKMILAK